MRTPITFNVGDQVGSVSILECHTTAELREDWYYQVKYDCCGLVATIKHKPLLFRIRKEAKFCHDCARKETNRKNRERAKSVPVIKPKRTQIYVDGWGLTL